MIADIHSVLELQAHLLGSYYSPELSDYIEINKIIWLRLQYKLR